MTADDLDDQLARLSALGEPVRRALYRLVIAASAPVSRDEAAAAVGVAHHVAKFHLDRLEQDGLLEAEFARPAGRSGPGAGRPTKRYRRTARELAVSLPERHYELAGHILAEAVSSASETGRPVAVALDEAAYRSGRRLVADTRPPARSGAAKQVAVCRALSESGFEPAETGTKITLANCPFRALAVDYPELVCGLNLSLVRGVLDGLSASHLHASLNPYHHGCCVEIEPAKRIRPA